MPPLLAAILIGAVSGIVAALCGVGGGIIMVPAFSILLGMPQKQAVATSLAAMILTAAVATVRNTENQLVDWRIALGTGAAAALLAWFAADWLRRLENATLSRVFAVVLIAVGVHMLFRKA